MNAQPGLAPERTRLAWDRTALSMAGFSLLLARFGLVDHVPVELAAAGTALLNAILVEVVGIRRARSNRFANTSEIGAIVMATTLTGLLTCVGLLLA